MAKQTNVISLDNSKDHVIDSYHFKVISELQNPNEANVAPTPNTQIPNTQTIQPSVEINQEEPKKEEDTSQNPEQSSFQSAFVEDLLKKTDEMSGNIIKLQMQMENQESEFNNRLNTELEGAKEKYTQEGYQKAKNEFEQQMSELRDKYLKSVAKLDEVAENLELFISKNEKELANTAIEIAKDVINKELDKHSSEIALNLAKGLFEELKNASKIELKVSPSDYDFIKSELKDIDRIKVSLDDAISKGSVIALSDVTNIEANLSSRLAKIQKMVL